MIYNATNLIVKGQSLNNEANTRCNDKKKLLSSLDYPHNCLSNIYFTSNLPCTNLFKCSLILFNGFFNLICSKSHGPSWNICCSVNTISLKKSGVSINKSFDMLNDSLRIIHLIHASFYLCISVSHSIGEMNIFHLCIGLLVHFEHNIQLKYYL